PSLIAATREEGITKTIPGKILRSIIILIILFSFFAIVFNLITEWLAVALDAPLVVIGIFAYLFLIIGRHKHFKTETLVYKLGEFGENFYTKFIELFHYKKTIYLGIMGMLALHLLTEVGNFIIPYLIGLKDAFYFEGLQEAGHTPLIFHYFKDIIAAQGLHKITFSLAYAFNYIAILFLLVVPAYLWYKMFKQSKFHFAKCVQSLVIASILTFLTLPMLKLEKITSQALVGVDIQTRSLETTFFINNYLPDKLLVIAITVILSLVIGIIMYILELNDKNKKRIFVTLIGIGMLFFGYYLFLFLASHLTYYLAAFKTLIALHSYILLIFIAIQALITVVFYIFGYIFFIYELSKHYRDVFSSV
ncbi:MAG: hypothetical protein KJ922_06990, partial [Nanoarchaeota archaeon]|nr:hypothetical protein [Nanoarchaeota archaeon]